MESVSAQLFLLISIDFKVIHPVTLCPNSEKCPKCLKMGVFGPGSGPPLSDQNVVMESNRIQSGSPISIKFRAFHLVITRPNDDKCPKCPKMGVFRPKSGPLLGDRNVVMATYAPYHITLKFQISIDSDH